MFHDVPLKISWTGRNSPRQNLDTGAKRIAYSSSGLSSHRFQEAIAAQLIVVAMRLSKYSERVR